MNPARRSVHAGTAAVALGALGMTMIIVSGGIDLSVGSAIALGSVVGATLIQKSTGLPAVILATILTGGAVGALNGGLIAGLRLTPFIVTLGAMGIIRGAAHSVRLVLHALLPV